MEVTFPNLSVTRMCLAKPHPLFSLLSATFIDRKLVFSCSNGRHGWLLNKGKSNCQSLPLGTASLPTACAQWKWTKQWLMVVHILALATYTVFTFRPVESEDMYLHKVIVAHQQFSCNAAAHSAYSFCHVG